MIENTDIMEIDTDYFQIIEAREYIVVIHSRNTGHDWCLCERIVCGQRTFLISHRHNRSKPFHPHKSKSSVKLCCDYIKDHDIFHLQRVRKREERRRRRELFRSHIHR